MVAGVAGELLQRRDVLGKTGTPEAHSGLQEFRSDPVVVTHASGHLGDVRAELVADVGDLVDERDLRCEEGVGGELDHLGAGEVGAHDRGPEHGIEVGDGIGSRLVFGLGPDDDPVGLEEVLDRGALLEELGAGHVGRRAQVALDRVAGSDRNGALHDQDVLAAVGELVDHWHHAREVGVAGIGRRRVDADEQQPGRIEKLTHVGCEGQPLGVLGDQLLQPRLVNRDLPSLQRIDLLGDDVAGGDGVPELGEAGGADQTHPADADHPDRRLFAHGFTCFGVGGLISPTERAMPSIWSAVRVCSRLL